MPALSVIGSPTKRQTILELATEADSRGFAGLAVPGAGGNLAMCTSLAHVTRTIPFWTSIQPIYGAHPSDVATSAGHIHEVSGGRFRLGLGVSHTNVLDRMGIAAGKPLTDTRNYVASLRASVRGAEVLPPIWLAALRDNMFDLAVEVGDGAIWANASQSHTPLQVARIPAERRASFSLSNMVPTVIDDDVDAARSVNRRTLASYLRWPNYRNYWRGAGFVEEMDAVEAALANNDRNGATAAMTDRWLDDCSISGGPTAVRDRLEMWHAMGVTPIAVMSSTTGGQAKAIRQLFDLYA